MPPIAPKPTCTPDATLKANLMRIISRQPQKCTYIIKLCPRILFACHANVVGIFPLVPANPMKMSKYLTWLFFAYATITNPTILTSACSTMKNARIFHLSTAHEQNNSLLTLVIYASQSAQCLAVTDDVGVGRPAICTRPVWP